MGWMFSGLVPLLFHSNRASDIPRKRECDGRPTIKPRPAWRGHDEDKWRGIDNSPPLISQAHDWKGFHPSHTNISVDERILRCAILLVVCAPLSSLRQSAAFCWVLPKQLPIPPSVMPTSALPKALSFKSFSHHKWEASRWKTKPLRKHIMTEKLLYWPKSVILVFLCSNVKR